MRSSSERGRVLYWCDSQLGEIYSRGNTPQVVIVSTVLEELLLLHRRNVRTDQKPPFSSSGRDGSSACVM